MSGEFSTPDELLTAGDAGADLNSALVTALGVGLTLFVLTLAILAIGYEQLPVVAVGGLVVAVAAGAAVARLDAGRTRDFVAGVTVAALAPAIAAIAGLLGGYDVVDAGVVALLVLVVLGSATPGVVGRAPLVGFAVAPAVPLGVLLAVVLVGGVEGAGPVGVAIAAAGFVPVAFAFGLFGVALAVAVRYAGERRQA